MTTFVWDFKKIGNPFKNEKKKLFKKRGDDGDVDIKKCKKWNRC